MRAVTGRTEAAAVPGVVEVSVSVAVGDRVQATGSFLDRMGHVMTVARTHRGAVSAAERALSRLHVDVDSFPEPEEERILTGPAAR